MRLEDKVKKRINSYIKEEILMYEFYQQEINSKLNRD